MQLSVSQEVLLLHLSGSVLAQAWLVLSAARNSSGGGDGPVQEGVACLEWPANLRAAGRQVTRPADALRVLAVEQHQALASIADVHHNPLPLGVLATATRSCCRFSAGGTATTLLQAGGPRPTCLRCSWDGLPPRLTIHLHVCVAKLALNLQGNR